MGPASDRPMAAWSGAVEVNRAPIPGTPVRNGMEDRRGLHLVIRSLRRSDNCDVDRHCQVIRVTPVLANPHARSGIPTWDRS